MVTITSKMERLYCYVMLCIFGLDLSFTFYVERGSIDTFNGTSECWKLNAYTYQTDKCKCYNHVRTLASDDNDKRKCTSSDKMKCKVFSDIKIISEIIEAFSTNNLDSSCDIDKIKIWNVPTESENEPALWVDVTDIASRHFSLNKTSYSMQIVSTNIIELWAGQLIKIELDCDNACALFKVKGRVSYPFAWTKLIQTTPKPTTTVVPSSKTSNNTTIYIIVGVVAVALILVIIMLSLYIVKKRNSRQPRYCEPTEVAEIATTNEAENDRQKHRYEEVYYSTIDPLPGTDQSYAQPNEHLCVSNPVYMDTTSADVIMLNGDRTSTPHYEELMTSDETDKERLYQNVELE